MSVDGTKLRVNSEELVAARLESIFENTPSIKFTHSLLLLLPQPGRSWHMRS